MKHRILIVAMILMSIQGFSQEKDSFFSVRGGMAVPIGNFSAQNITNGSFALPGIYLGAEGAWFFMKHFGVGAEIGLEYNSIDASALATAKVNSDPFMTDLTVRAEPFQVHHGAVGIYTRWEIFRHLSATAKVLGGMVWGMTPYELYKPTYFGAGPDYYEITSSKDHQYFVEPGVGLQYRFNRSVGLQLDAEYITRNMSFRFVKADQSLEILSRQINIINTSLGLIIYL